MTTVTVRDVLTLSALQESYVVAGERGLDRVVSGVNVIGAVRSWSDCCLKSPTTPITVIQGLAESAEIPHFKRWPIGLLFGKKSRAIVSLMIITR